MSIIMKLTQSSQDGITKKRHELGLGFMSVALSYDHRIIDGREAVSFLVRVKQCIEDPTRMLLDA